jgi:FixJ family two-component response regulator
LSKTKIVSIVDDDASVRAGMEALVNSIGFTACVFDAAEKFLRSSEIEDTSCLVTDVQMPGMNGLELQSRLIAEGRRIPIIFITAFPDQSGRERALNRQLVPFFSGRKADAASRWLMQPSL